MEGLRSGGSHEYQGSIGEDVFTRKRAGSRLTQ